MPHTCPLRAALLLSLCLAACASDPSKPDARATEAARGEVGGLCGPPSAADIAACEDPKYSALGKDKAHAVEWGRDAGFAHNFAFDRLQCRDGSIPSTRRLGNVGALDAPSSSPASSPDPSDVIDVWQVSCDGSGERFEVYHNLYRCGVRCPPAGLSWSQPEEQATMAEARALIGAGKKEEAAKLLNDRLTRYPSSERVVLAAANSLIEEDEVAARAMLGEHCERGNKHACRALGMMVMNTNEGPQRLSRACELGHKAACYDASFSAFITDSLTPETVDSALEQLDTACSESYPRACVYLAIMMKRSDVPQSRWLPLLDRACKEDDSLACELMEDEAKNSPAPADGKER